jgi:AcrR family transcriptional regulator
MAPTRTDEILHAAMSLVLTKGVNALTIDAVARTAKLSKGGVLYHFPSKESLIAGMIAGLIAGFEADVAKHLEKDNQFPGAFTRAYLRASLDPINPSAGDASTKLGLFAALSAGTAMDPKLIEPLQQGFVAWQKRLESDGISPVLATMVRVAVDGLWFAEVLNLGVPAKSIRRNLVTHLLELTRTPIDNAQPLRRNRKA